MIEWIVSSSVLIVLIIVIRKVFRKKLDMRVLYALWLIVAVRLLVPVSFAESGLSVQNLVDAGRELFRQEMVEVSGMDGEETGDGSHQIVNGNFGTNPGNEGSQGSVDNLWNAENPGAENSGSLPGNAGEVFEGSSDVFVGELFPEGIIREEPGFSQELQQENTIEGSVGEKSPANIVAVTGKIFTYVWSIGTLFSALVLLGANWWHRRSVYGSRRKLECAESRLPVYISDMVKTPCMFGVIKPAIYLTEAALSDPKAMKYILCHENTHYRHRDNWWAVVRALCLCLHWYNPLMWLAAHLSKQDCELACDEETIAQLDAAEKVDYGRVLLNFSISGENLYGKLQLATTMSGGKKQLKERLQMIVREPKRYVWALVMVALLVVLVLGVTFTGKAEESSNMDNPSVTVEPTNELTGNPTSEPTAEPTANPTAGPTAEPTAESTAEPVQGTMGGYMSYTGYMDECYTYEGYDSFVGQDYDEDGLIDRVWREDIKNSSMGSYRIEFGNGDVLLVEKIGDGFPDITCGDLDGDGINEILFRAIIWGSTDPDSYGEWAVFKKNGSTYEMLKLPESMADYESDGNGGVPPAYWPMLPLAVEDVGDYQARIYCVGKDGTDDLGEGFSKDVALDVVIDFGEEDWKTIDMDDYITTRSDYLDLDNNGNIYSAEILEEGMPMLRTYTSLFGKWCSDEIVTTFVLKDGMLQVYSMEYTHDETVKKNVNLGDDKIYQLHVGITYVHGDKAQRINYIHLEEEGSVWGVDTVDLQEASKQEWGTPQEVWGYEDYAIVIEDFNFDGCDDLAVQGWIGAKNIPYYCFLWNPVTRQYEYSALIPNVEVDKENRLVISYTNDGGGQYSTTYYKYDDKNQLHMVRYIGENLSPEAALPKLDLTYYADDYYALPAVDQYDKEAACYEGVRVSEMIYHTKLALEELYAYTGYRVEQAYFTVMESGNIVFGQTEDDMKRGRNFYTRSYNGLDPGFNIIPSMFLVTERDVWYSPVIQWNVPENHQTMAHEDIVRWFFERAPFAAGEVINYMEENYAGNYVIEAESGNWYEVTYNAEKRLISSIYGPYPEYPTH